MPAPLPNVLNLKPEDAIRDMSISEVLANHFKHSFDINDLMGSSDKGPMN